MSSVLLCSVDSLLAALAIGAVGLSRTARNALILTFAIGDSTAMLLGSVLHLAIRPPDVDGLSYVVVLLTAVSCLVATAWNRRFAATLMAIPVLLSLDNFISALHDAVTPASALVAGVTSGAFAWGGFTLVQALRSGFTDDRRFRQF